MKRDITKLSKAVLFVKISTISIVSIFIAHNVVLTLSHFMHETPNSNQGKLGFLVFLLFLFVFFSLMVTFRSVTDPIEHQASIYWNATHKTNHKEVTHAT